MEVGNAKGPGLGEDTRPLPFLGQQLASSWVPEPRRVSERGPQRSSPHPPTDGKTERG